MTSESYKHDVFLRRVNFILEVAPCGRRRLMVTLYVHAWDAASWPTVSFGLAPSRGQQFFPPFVGAKRTRMNRRAVKICPVTVMKRLRGRLDDEGRLLRHRHWRASFTRDTECRLLSSDSRLYQRRVYNHPRSPPKIPMSRIVRLCPLDLACNINLSFFSLNIFFGWLVITQTKLLLQHNQIFSP